MIMDLNIVTNDQTRKDDLINKNLLKETNTMQR
jgi:hypothetical protein